MAKDGEAAAAPAADGAAHIAAIVEPIKAIGATAGFAIGDFTAHRAGEDWVDTVLHGLVGSLLLSLLAWFTGLVLVREAIRAKVDGERADYDAKVATARRQIVETLRERGHDIPDSYLEAGPRRPELGSGG